MKHLNRIHFVSFAFILFNIGIILIGIPRALTLSPLAGTAFICAEVAVFSLFFLRLLSIWPIKRKIKVEGFNEGLFLTGIAYFALMTSLAATNFNAGI